MLNRRDLQQRYHVGGGAYAFGAALRDAIRPLLDRRGFKGWFLHIERGISGPKSGF